MVLSFLENALNLGIFTPAPFPTQKSPPSFYHHLRQSEITHSPRQHFFENIFPQTAARGGGNYDLIHQNSIRKYEDGLEY